MGSGGTKPGPGSRTWRGSSLTHTLLVHLRNEGGGRQTHTSICPARLTESSPVATHTSYRSPLPDLFVITVLICILMSFCRASSLLWLRFPVSFLSPLLFTDATHEFSLESERRVVCRRGNRSIFSVYHFMLEVSTRHA